ncbi:MAG: hypothetical protein LKI53_04775 [Bacteroidales bacterium]|nr:hypothetical protein [Bacteroidales bacterium]
MKPKNENIRYLIEKYSLKHPVYVGDTDSDMEQARIAGIPFIFAAYGFGKVEGCDLRINSFGELQNVLS